MRIGVYSFMRVILNAYTHTRINAYTKINHIKVNI